MESSCRYDGTFDGFLTLVGSLLPGRFLPGRISVQPPLQQDLFHDVLEIVTDAAAAAGLRKELGRRLGREPFDLVVRAFLADRPERELVICRYLFLGWDVGRGIASMLAHPDVAPLRNLARQVAREAHRYLGFVRFRETRCGVFYGAIAPDHRILPLIARHFAQRFPDQNWIIHDTRHGEGLVHDRQRGRWLLLPMEATAEPEPTPAEERFQQWWRTYFATLAVVERKNLRLQQSKVPLKARSHLVEFAETTFPPSTIR